MLPEDAEKRRNDTAVTPHLRADHSRRGFLIPYDDDLFRRDAAILRLASTDQLLIRYVGEQSNGQSSNTV